MALKVTKVEVWAGDLRDVPGGLADVLEQVAKGGESIDFLIARRTDKHAGVGKVFLTPVTTPKAKDAAGRAALRRAVKLSTLRVEGTDAKGMGSKMTRAMADAGVNVKGVSAAVIGNKFVAYIGFDSEEDADSAMAALKRLKVNGAPSRKRAGSRSTTRGGSKARAGTRSGAGTRSRGRTR